MRRSRLGALTLPLWGRRLYFIFFAGKENVLLISSELPPKALQCVGDIEHKWWWWSKWGLQEPSRACKSSVKAAGDVCEYVISTGSLKGRQSLREHRKQNTQWTSCWVAALFHLFVQPIFWSVMCVCECVCLLVCEGGSSQVGWSVWVEETLHIPEPLPSLCLRTSYSG